MRRRSGPPMSCHGHRGARVQPLRGSAVILARGEKGGIRRPPLRQAVRAAIPHEPVRGDAAVHELRSGWQRLKRTCFFPAPKDHYSTYIVCCPCCIPSSYCHVFVRSLSADPCQLGWADLDASTVT